jgi:hypothetical protein
MGIGEILTALLIRDTLRDRRAANAVQAELDAITARIQARRWQTFEDAYFDIEEAILTGVEATTGDEIRAWSANLRSKVIGTRRSCGRP